MKFLKGKKNKKGEKTSWSQTRSSFYLVHKF